jgi:hypothetical protein
MQGYSRGYDMRNGLRKFEGSEVAVQRMKIIRFYERYGEKATIEVFGTDRKVINRWRKRLKEMDGKLIALIPLSTRPKRVRKSNVPLEIIEFIRALREGYPKLGKEKIKPLLDEYCTRHGMKSISESTIGNIIKRYQLYFQKPDKIYCNLQSKWAKKIENGERSPRLLACFKPV